MTDEPSSPAATASDLTTSLGTIGAWSIYAKDRFDFASKRVDEFRNWARQLAGVIGVVIGFEFSFIGRALDLKPPFDHDLRLIALSIFLVTILFQLGLLGRLLRTGYTGQQVLGPESPTVLAKYIAQADETATKQMIGAYYAKATDNFHEQSERLGAEVGTASKTFRISLLALVVGLGFLVWLSAKTYTDPAMAASGNSQTSVSTPSAPTSAAPVASATQPAAPPTPAIPPATASPLLLTPTEGQRQTLSAQPQARKTP